MPSYSYSGGAKKKSVNVNKSNSSTSTSSQSGGSGNTVRVSGPGSYTVGNGGVATTGATGGTAQGAPGVGTTASGATTVGGKTWQEVMQQYQDAMRAALDAWRTSSGTTIGDYRQQITDWMSGGMDRGAMPTMPDLGRPTFPAFPDLAASLGATAGTPNLGAILPAGDPRNARLQQALAMWEQMTGRPFRLGGGDGAVSPPPRQPGTAPPMGSPPRQPGMGMPDDAYFNIQPGGGTPRTPDFVRPPGTGPRHIDTAPFGGGQPGTGRDFTAASGSPFADFLAKRRGQIGIPDTTYNRYVRR